MIYTISILLYGFCVLYTLYTGIYIEYLYYVYIYTYIYIYLCNIHMHIYTNIYNICICNIFDFVPQNKSFKDFSARFCKVNQLFTYKMLFYAF